MKKKDIVDLGKVTFRSWFIHQCNADCCFNLVTGGVHVYLCVSVNQSINSCVCSACAFLCALQYKAPLGRQKLAPKFFLKSDFLSQKAEINVW